MYFLRSLFLVFLAPALTLAISVVTIFLAVFCKYSPKDIQFLPRFWGRVISRVAGVRVSVEGIENLDPAKTYIFAGNHQSQFDIFTLQGYLDFDFRWLAKKELFNVPLFGQGMKYGGYVSVDRAHGRQAVKSLDLAAKRIASGTSVIIFPEGTRSRDGKLQPFKAGGFVLAIKSGVPIVPMAILGTHDILPKGKLLTRPGIVKIRIGKPIDISGYNVKQKHELSDLVRSRVEALMAQPTSVMSDNLAEA